jgi:hypothetical protein
MEARGPLMYYSIVRIDDEGYGESLAEFDTYREADDAYDDYVDKYPYDIVDIVDVYASRTPEG